MRDFLKKIACKSEPVHEIYVTLTSWPPHLFGRQICGSGYWRKSEMPSSCHIRSKLYVVIVSVGFACLDGWFSICEPFGDLLSASGRFCSSTRRLVAEYVDLAIKGFTIWPVHKLINDLPGNIRRCGPQFSMYRMLRAQWCELFVGLAGRMELKSNCRLLNAWRQKVAALHKIGDLAWFALVFETAKGCFQPEYRDPCWTNGQDWMPL